MNSGIECVFAEDPVSYILGTSPPGPAAPFAQLIRGHWGGCEIRNHAARDVYWEEDKTRSRKLQPPLI